MNTKELIYQKAIQLFLERGYNRVSINRICGELNLTKGAFYHYYDSKENILEQFYDGLYKKEAGHFAEMIRIENPVERIWQMILFTTKENIQLGSNLLYRILLIRVKTGVNNPEEAISNVKKALLEGIIEGQEKGLIRSGVKGEDLLSAFVHGFLGISVLWDDGTVALDLIEETEKLFGIIFLENPKLN